MMKKKIFLIAAALTGLCLTACGQDSADFSTALSAPEVTTLTEEAAPAETSVTVTEAAVTTEIAESIAVTEMPSADAAQTTASQTAAAEVCPYSAADLTGEWSMPGNFGTRNNSMTVRNDGTVIMRYAAGGTRFGKLRIDKEEHPDGTAGYWYSVYDDDNTAWIGFPCGDLPVSRIASGQDGETEFVRISLADLAAEKMNNLTFLMKSLSGGGGDLATDPGRTVTADGQTYTLVTDNRFAIGSFGKIAFERLLEETVTGAEYTHWKAVLDDSIRVSEADGQTYVLTSAAHGFLTFETGNGVTVTDQTETSFTAATVDENQLDGRGIAHFVFDGTNWTIESYEFK